MKKKKMKRKTVARQERSQEDQPKGALMKKYGAAFLIAASYQVFSMGMDSSCPFRQQDPDRCKTRSGNTTAQISSLFLPPAMAAPPINECRCVGGHGGGGSYRCNCTSCTSCTSCTGSCTACTGRTRADEIREYNSLYQSFSNAWAAGRWAEAEALIRQMIRSQQGPRNYTNLALTIIYQGRYAEAEQALERAKGLDGSWFSMPDYLKDAYAFLHRKKGEDLIYQRRYAEAEVSLKKVLDFNSNDSETYNHIGRSLQGQKKYDQAIEAYEKALKINSNNSAAKGNLQNLKLWIVRKKADDCFNRQDDAGAEAGYREALRIKPDDAHATQLLGAALAHQKRYADAEPVLRRAVQLAPQNADIRNYLGHTLDSLGKSPEAEAEYRAALKLDKNHLYARNNLAYILNRKALILQAGGRNRQAEAAALESLQLEPKNASANSILGAALQEQGKLGEAEAAYRRAIGFDPTFASPKNKLAGLLADRGKSLTEHGWLSEAEAVFREALSLNPSSAEAAQGMKSLEAKREERRSAKAIAAVPKETPGKASPDAGSFTVVLKDNGRDVPVTFILPQDPNTGPKAASAQLKSASSGGKQAVEAAGKRADIYDSSGDLARAKHRSGDMFDRPGEHAEAMAPVVLKGLPPPQTRPIPPRLFEDKTFKKLWNDRMQLIEEQQRLEQKLQDVRKKKESAGSVEKGKLDVEEAKIKQDQSVIPGKIRIQENAMGEMISRAFQWEQKQGAEEIKSPVNDKKKASGGKAR